MTRKVRPLALVLTLAVSSTASAELIVSIGSATVLGGQAIVDVDLINNGTAVVSLNQYAFQFQILPQSNVPAELSFTAPQPQPFGDPNYVFYGNSAAAPGPLGALSMTNTPDDTYIGGDGTADGTNVTIAGGSTSMLLTPLEVSYNGSYQLTPGTFQIGLVPTSSNIATTDTYFQYTGLDGNEVDVTFSSKPGTITVTPNSGPPILVPEPSTLVMLATGSLVALPTWFASRRRAGRRSTTTGWRGAGR